MTTQPNWNRTAGNAWVVATLMTLQNVVAGTLTADNVVWQAPAGPAATAAPVELVGVAGEQVAIG